jgi:hypothetical protein
MRVSDEELERHLRIARQNCAPESYLDVCKDLRDLRKLARDFLLTISDECSCDTTCGTHDETCDTITTLKAHLEAKP